MDLFWNFPGGHFAQAAADEASFRRRKVPGLQQSTLAPAVPANVEKSTTANSQLGVQSISEYLVAAENTADEKRYMFTCYRSIEKLRKKRTRMGNEGEIRMARYWDTPKKPDMTKKRTRKSGATIEKESTLRTNSLDFIFVTGETCHELRD